MIKETPSNKGSTCTKIVLCICAAIALCAVAAGIQFFRAAQLADNEYQDAYANWAATILVLQYLEKYGTWPTGWNDLRNVQADLKSDVYPGGIVTNFLETTPTYLVPTNIDEISSRVHIKWHVNLEELSNAQLKPGEAPFYVITSVEGGVVHLPGLEPNELLLRYLRWKPTAKDHQQKVEMSRDEK